VAYAPRSDAGPLVLFGLPLGNRADSEAPRGGQEVIRRLMFAAPCAATLAHMLVHLLQSVGVLPHVCH